MLGQEIHGLRLTLGMTQSDLTELLGVTRQCVTDWESGAVDPPRAVVLLLTAMKRMDNLQRDVLWADAAAFQRRTPMPVEWSPALLTRPAPTAGNRCWRAFWSGPMKGGAVGRGVR